MSETTIEIYKKPEVKAAISLMKDPTPSHVLYNYLKSSATAALQKQSSVFERPIDSFKAVANEGIGAGGAALGYRLAGMLAGGAGPKGQALTRIASGILGRWAAMEAGNAVMNAAENAAAEADMLPGALTNVNMASANQATGAAIGNLSGMMTAVPTAVAAVRAGVSPLLAIPSSLISGALVARVGQGLGTMVGGYLDNRESLRN